MTRAALVSALDALELGDESYAHSILVSALADEKKEGRQTYACPDCPNTYKWPGALADHRRSFHGFEEAE
jgi:hypothetical protein